MSASWFLGVDGGQSSTSALVGDAAGRVLGVGHGGPCAETGGAANHAHLRESLQTALRGAMEGAGLSLANSNFESACVGLSGGAAEKQTIVREIIRATHLAVTSDAVVALAGAMAGEPGVIAIAGTGSIAYGRNSEGRTARAGGWGYAFGDEGGAFDVVRQALRAALRNEEGWGPDTALRSALLQETGAPNANDLLHLFYTAEYPRARIASYARIVDSLAQQGDPVARDILNGAAQALATFVAAVRRQLFHRGDSPRISFIGGVFESAIVRERFRLLVELEGDCRAQPPAFGPAAGALMEAYRIAGRHLHPSNAPAGV